jgi:probable HAF family extracellular repeat protein
MKLADHLTPRKLSVRTGPRFGAAALVSGALVASAALALAGCSSAGQDKVALSGDTSSSMQMSGSLAGSYQVLTLNDTRDITFNQLLGINNEGVIAGYFGSGAAGHPNKGYVLRAPFAQADFRNENFPRGVQTQVTGLNDRGVTVGFWSPQNTASMSNANFGFYSVNGRFFSVNFPTGTPAKPAVDQLLGVNDLDVAVGFFTNNSGINRGYTYNINSRKFSRVLPPGASGSNLGASLTAAGINNFGDVAGFYNTNAKTGPSADAFLKLHSGQFITISFPAAGVTMTQAFGVNDAGEVVGTYTTGSGNSAVTHGFTWLNGKFASVNIGGASSTTINGVNDEGDLVGFYTDAKGNTDGFFALP